MSKTLKEYQLSYIKKLKSELSELYQKKTLNGKAVGYAELIHFITNREHNLKSQIMSLPISNAEIMYNSIIKNLKRNENDTMAK
jgi:hypothetical protein